MDRIEPRIHDEIKDYKEKFYNFTLRQWLFGILVVIVVVPLYLFLSPLIGSDLAGWIVIFVATPIVFFGFIPIQGLNAEKMFPYWKRNYINFNKPILYKTQEEIEKAKEAKRFIPKLTKEEKRIIKRKIKEEKEQQRKIKIERQRQRDLVRAKQKFGVTKNTLLSDEEIQTLLNYVNVGKGNNPNETKKEIQKEEQESQE